MNRVPRKRNTMSIRATVKKQREPKLCPQCWNAMSLDRETDTWECPKHGKPDRP